MNFQAFIKLYESQANLVFIKKTLALLPSKLNPALKEELQANIKQAQESLETLNECMTIVNHEIVNQFELTKLECLKKTRNTVRKVRESMKKVKENIEDIPEIIGFD